VHIGKWTCGALAALVVSAPALALNAPPVVVITLDARDYVAYTATSLIPAAGWLDVAQTPIANCRRANGEMPASGDWRLHRSAEPLDVDFATLRVEFKPTRLVLDSATRDIVCDGQALGWQTGLGRVFEDDFDA
jgi:hypothetical protein